MTLQFFFALNRAELVSLVMECMDPRKMCPIQNLFSFRVPMFDMDVILNARSHTGRRYILHGLVAIIRKERLPPSPPPFGTALIESKLKLWCPDWKPCRARHTNPERNLFGGDSSFSGLGLRKLRLGEGSSKRRFGVDCGIPC